MTNPKTIDIAPCAAAFKRLRRARDHAESLRQEIDKRRTAEAYESARGPSTEAVKKAREDLAAARAIGQLTAQELTKRSAEIDALSQAAEKAQAAAQAETDARAGLERLLQSAEDEIRRLEQEGRDTVMQWVCKQAELVGDRYLEAARGVHDFYVQLTALERIANLVGGVNSRFAGPAHSGYCIPTFQFASHHPENETGWHHHRLFINGDVMLGQQIEQATAAEIEQLRAAGVEI